MPDNYTADLAPPQQDRASTAAEKKAAYIEALKYELAGYRAAGNERGVREVEAEIKRVTTAPLSEWELAE